MCHQAAALSGLYLVGAGRFLNKTLCPRAKAAALHSSRGVTSNNRYTRPKGCHSQGTLMTMQEVLSYRLSIVYNFHPDPENKYRAAFRKEFSKSELSELRKGNLGEF